MENVSPSAFPNSMNAAIAGIVFRDTIRVSEHVRTNTPNVTNGENN